MAETLSFPEQVRIYAVRICESGPAALSGLFDLTATRLLRFAVTITRNQHDAEDAMQAALVKVASNPKFLRNADAPWSYLLQMVRNEALVILRKKKRQISLTSLCDLVHRRNVDELQQEETHHAIWLALRALPTEQSSVVVLKIWEQMTLAEVAAVMDISLSTAASRYRYGLAKLAPKLKRLQAEACYA